MNKNSAILEFRKNEKDLKIEEILSFSIEDKNTTSVNNFKLFVKC